MGFGASRISTAQRRCSVLNCGGPSGLLLCHHLSSCRQTEGRGLMQIRHLLTGINAKTASTTLKFASTHGPRFLRGFSNNTETTNKRTARAAALHKHNNSNRLFYRAQAGSNPEQFFLRVSRSCLRNWISASKPIILLARLKSLSTPTQCPRCGCESMC